MPVRQGTPEAQLASPLTLLVTPDIVCAATTVIEAVEAWIRSTERVPLIPEFMDVIIDDWIVSDISAVADKVVDAARLDLRQSGLGAGLAWAPFKHMAVRSAPEAPGGVTHPE